MSVAHNLAAVIASLLAITAADADSPFATRVMNFDPAPGQFVQHADYNDPTRAIGPPIGGGLRAADNSKMVSLGGFGGSITLGFDRRVFDNRFNRYGVDFIIFGNAFWVVGDSTRRFAEAGVVEVSRDDNANGLADDAWYVIAGSDLAPPLTQNTISWDDQTADNLLPPASPLWIPAGRSGTWATSGYLLGGTVADAMYNTHVLVHPGGPSAIVERAFGYADLSPTALLGDHDGDNIVEDPTASPSSFYTLADDPHAVGLSAGSGGGDGFDIAEARDPATGLAPSPPLAWIDFVRVRTAAHATHPSLGEISTEVAAVADARPTYVADWNQDGSVSVQDIFDFLTSYFTASALIEGGGADFNDSGMTTVQDIFDYLVAYFAGT